MILGLIEPLLLLTVALLAPVFAKDALEGSLAAAALRGEVGDADVLRVALRLAGWQFAGAGVLLALVRLATRFARQGNHILTPVALPAAYAALGMGFTLQTGYGDPFSAHWPGPAFATGVLCAGVAGAFILAVPGDIGALLSRARWPLLGVALVLVGLLGAFGTAPGESGQTINLWGFQPIELVKFCVVLAVGSTLGARATKLRWHRMGPGWLRIPPPKLLIQATLILVAGWVALFAVRDFGPTLILAFVFMGLFYVVTRSPVWVALGLGVTAALLAVFWFNPDLAPSSSLALRIDMWRDPWLNGRAHGDQLAMANWAMAAGGGSGIGAGSGVPGALPAGHTDLVYAHLVEVFGICGGALYLALLVGVVADGLRVAAFNRTPERVMMAAALGLLLVGQAAVILLGTLGLFPLTGVVVPFLSFGKTGSLVLLALVAILVRLGEDGVYRADTDELRELRRGVQHLRLGLLALGLALAVGTGLRAGVDRDAVSLRVVVTTLEDGTPILLHDPRLTVLASQVRRGSILDRSGDLLAASPVAGTRVNPLGDAFGTVLGAVDQRLGRAAWQVERQLNVTLRGWPERASGQAVWLAGVGSAKRVVFAPPPGERTPEGERQLAEARASARGFVGALTRITLTDPDLSGLLPIARMPIAERTAAIGALAQDVAARTVSLSIDAKLQQRVAKAVRAAAAKSQVEAASVVVMDSVTGQVLARAQWPDFDPSSAAWRAERAADDPTFMGVYGAWADKTGARGTLQAGSVFKLLSAVVAVREGLVGSGVAAGACPGSSAPNLECDEVHDGRPSFTLPGWSRPIHDHGDGGARGTLDLVGAISRSSNVYFGQLALILGPEPYRRLRTEGVEFGNPGLLAEKDGLFTGLGEGGSRRLAQTGFGQGAGSWSPMQAARLVAAIANGGSYLRCPSTMEMGADCERTELLPPGSTLEPILAGMRSVMLRGTGSKLGTLAGVRVYGKTGTADAPGTRDEAAWGIRPGGETKPHSWFVAIAEPSSSPECANGGERYVVAAVVPHGGFGASAAGPLAMEAIRALQAESYLPSGGT